MDRDPWGIEKHLCVGREKILVQNRYRQKMETPLRRQRKEVTVIVTLL